MRWAWLLSLLACASPTGQDPLAQRVTATAWETWEASGLPEIPEERCRTALFEVQFPDVAGFDRLCAPATTDQANGCFRWLVFKRPWQGIRETISKPVAVVDPTLPAGTDIEKLALHELRHGLVYCTLHRPASDPYDAGHTDQRVWGPETRALWAACRSHP